jgi:cytochrome c oxidase assembly protein subunit 15
MPFDNQSLPTPETATAKATATATARRGRVQVAAWLFCVAFMIFGMVVLGGATRLTGSGLSIMEWAPLSGIVPPLSHHEWQRLFTLYKQIPQYALLHEGMSLGGFQSIFWLEYLHRAWGRLIGLVFLVPLIVFAVRGMIGRRMLPRLLLLFVLGGLQGAVGWFMVASGFFPDATAVAPLRLVVHLSLALVLFSAVLWLALSTLSPVPEPVLNGSTLRRLALLSTGLVALTIVAGGFTAGLHAGLIYNTFPLMDGRLFPAGYAALHPFAANLVANVTAVQFDHRLLATLTALAVLATLAVGFPRVAQPRVRTALVLMGCAVTLQYGLGIATLLSVVAIPLAACHQAVAVLLLASGLFLTHTLRGARLPSTLS